MFWRSKENNFKKILSYSYSDSDIRHYLPDAKIIEYMELKAYNNLLELLPNDKSYAFILVETAKRKGHWVCIARLGNGETNGKVLYFDSCAKDVDEELRLISPWWRKELQETEKLLLKLVNDCPYEVEYNGVKLQTNEPWDNSCGRYCVFFILKFLQGLDLSQFIDFIDFYVENNDLEKYGKFKYDICCIDQISYTPS